MTQAADVNGHVTTTGGIVVGIPKNLVAARIAVALAAPAGVGITCVLGWLFMHIFSLIVYEKELVAAAAISVAAGLIAMLPMLIWMGKGGIAIVWMTMLAMPLRMGLSFVGLFIAFGSGRHLDLGALVVWTAVCYGAVMVAEGGATVWATRH